MQEPEEGFVLSRILLIVQRLWRGGGTETHVLSLALGLKNRGHSVAVLTSGGPWVPVFRSRGIPVYVDPSFFDISGSVANLWELIFMKNFTVVHAHDSASFNLVAATLGQYSLDSVRVLMTVHGPYVTAASIRKLAPYAHALIAVSPAIRQYVRNAGVNRRVYLVPNGIDMRLFQRRTDNSLRRSLGIPGAAFVVGYAGRFTADKMVLSRQIGRSLCQYATVHSGVYALIVGRNAKFQLVGGPSCKVIGYMENMPLFYNSCNVVVGTARVALESLATSTPTIAVGHTKYVGIVRKGNLQQGYLSNFGDHGQIQSGTNLKGLLTDVDYIRNHREQSLKEARNVSAIVRKRFSLQRIVQSMEDFYVTQ